MPSRVATARVRDGGMVTCWLIPKQCNITSYTCRRSRVTYAPVLPTSYEGKLPHCSGLPNRITFNNNLDIEICYSTFESLKLQSHSLLVIGT